jgi:hypothetical protein
MGFFTFRENSNDNRHWDNLIDEIVRGNVIPVIGPEVLIDMPNQSDGNIHTILIDCLSKFYGITEKYKSFSDLIYDPQFKAATNDDVDDIYYKVNEAYEDKLIESSKSLREFLATKQFPFVLTTSYTPVVEQVMSEIWGKVKVMKFCNNPTDDNDITDENDMRKPTIYYMFGHVGDGAHKYVLTDIDMLNFCSSWLSDVRRPKNLCNELKNKYLLILGNDYSDWLFRFIWFSIRKSNMSNGMLAYDKIDESLIHFLERNKTFTKQNPTEVINQILSRLRRKIAENENYKFNRPQDNMDVFISYSRSDKLLAEALYTKLTAEGKRVWYDKNNLTDGGNFMDEIRKAIRTAKYFIPILSVNIAKEKNDSHVYRNEWDLAISVAISMGRTYIIPIAENGFDFYKASIPEKLQQHNAIFYSKDEGLNNVIDKILHIMNQD